MDNIQDSMQEKFFKVTEDTAGRKQEEEVFFRYKRTYKFEEKYMMLFQGALLNRAIENGGIERTLGKTGQVLFYLLLNMNFENMAMIKQSTVAKKFNMTRQNTSKIFKKLEAEGFITKSENGFYKFDEDCPLHRNESE